MGKRIFEIKIGKIRPNLRSVYSIECIEETAKSLRCRGQLEPILVYFAEDSFRILDGEKRYRACKKLGIKTIKAVVVPAG